MAQYKVNSSCLLNLCFIISCKKTIPHLGHQDRTRESSTVPFPLPLYLSGYQSKVILPLCYLLHSSIFLVSHHFLPGFLLSYLLLVCLQSVLSAAVMVLFLNCKGDHFRPRLNMSVVPVALRRKSEHLGWTRVSIICPLSAPLTHPSPYLVVPCFHSPCPLRMPFLCFTCLISFFTTQLKHCLLCEDHGCHNPHSSLGWCFPHFCCSNSIKHSGLWLATKLFPEWTQLESLFC